MKGLEWALVAVRALVDSGVPVRLEVLGDGSERERVRHTVVDLGLEKHVELCGEVSSEEVASRLRGSDALVLPSLDEGLPTVILEAMASGIPVVASDCGGVREAITDGVEGFVVPPRDSGALTRALERLWREPELRARMGEAGRRTVTSRFTLERQLDEFLVMYRELERS
jgi:glycosyltransferase involved in cell wall biosynthesis